MHRTIIAWWSGPDYLVRILFLPAGSSVTMGKLLILSAPQFSHLKIVIVIVGCWKINTDKKFWIRCGTYQIFKKMTIITFGCSPYLFCSSFFFSLFLILFHLFLCQLFGSNWAARKWTIYVPCKISSVS